MIRHTLAPEFIRLIVLKKRDNFVFKIVEVSVFLFFFFFSFSHYFCFFSYSFHVMFLFFTNGEQYDDQFTKSRSNKP